MKFPPIVLRENTGARIRRVLALGTSITNKWGDSGSAGATRSISADSYLFWMQVALMGQVDLWILALLIPVQFLSYYATGGMIFSYLRSKGNLKEQSHWFTTRLALELNFVNHILPSGGAAGFSYLAWILSKFKVSVSRSTMSQIIRFVMTFISFIVLLIVAIIILAFTGHLEHITIFIAIGLAAAAIGGIFILVWLIKSNERLRNFSAWLTKTINRFIRWITRGKKRKVVKEEVFLEFFGGLHDDFLALRRDRKTLIVPFIWALIANMLDVALIWISFWALGFAVDPALLFVAFGVASIAGAVLPAEASTTMPPSSSLRPFHVSPFSAPSTLDRAIRSL